MLSLTVPTVALNSRCQLLAPVSNSRSLSFRCGSWLNAGCSRHSLRCYSKGFSSNESPTSQKAATNPAPADANVRTEGDLDIEAQIKNSRRRMRAAQAKVKVVSPVVEAIKQQKPLTAASQVETAFVQFLGVYFAAIILDGIVIAASGLLPQSIDQFVQDVLYPSYTYVVLAFVGCSAFYGLFKTGALPGQRQL